MTTSSGRRASCADCPLPADRRICRMPEGTGPKGCPSIGFGDRYKQVESIYTRPEVREYARQASIQEAACYAGREVVPYVKRPVKPRIQEIVEFAHRMGYERLGLAFCSGLHEEARLATEVFRAQGFDVVSVVCKVGGVPKKSIGVRDDEKINIGSPEAMCNPVGQAMVLNEAGTDFNVVLGLCVGHDALFFKFSEALTTVLAVKDRLLGHNPLAILYTLDSYHPWMRKSSTT
ncbi:hypothetical protein AMJ39_04100 [candidate division TA06 bacterium DG_24]|uniref:Metal-binding protein n=3 Tax=Bacteria division TA06 TaxID=1156500 RepID=A0A0S8JCB6_UNCT6|nr:MAG: hypothetical protein AMJ39_04100 [candidate division TA06 bacterium DG_24]KPK70574.1 MAG: hypothetical protein AMJ82_02930 [candidate division TA06 bacterium SM23_40]KPL06429.1 MAG: hypothetical protein AMJ71_09685 [candidate division TA06 bacterium SM1_40]